MPSISDNRAFREYYDNLIRHPKQVNEKLALMDIQDTFKALAEAKINPHNEKTIHFGDRSIKVSEFGEKEVKVFTQFAKLYFKSHAVAEEKTFDIIESLNTIGGLGSLKRELLIHEKIENVSHSLSEDISIQTDNAILKQLQINQNIAYKEQKSGKEEKKRSAIVGGILAGIGVAVLATGIALTISFGISFGIGALAIGPIALFGGGLLLALPQTFGDWRIEETIQNMEKLEKYRRMIKDEKFIDFAKREAINPLELNHNKAFNDLFERYEREKGIKAPKILEKAESESIPLSESTTISNVSLESGSQERR